MGAVARAAAHAVLPGSGSAGLVWKRAAAELQHATVLPLPDEPDVAAMAQALQRCIEKLPRPRVLVGSSLGALVALELVRDVQVDALVLVAAGFGIDVHPSVLARIAAEPQGLLQTMARGVVADPDNEPLTGLIARDFEARGQGVLLRHMTVLARHRPRPLSEPPPTLVLWGMQDPGVPLAAHVELALRCKGPLVPIANAGHLPYLEQPEETVRWIQWAGSRMLASSGSAETASREKNHRPS
jgi:pimeloyl-ACP methyl ester carboxylesterase